MPPRRRAPVVSSVVFSVAGGGRWPMARGCDDRARARDAGSARAARRAGWRRLRHGCSALACVAGAAAALGACGGTSQRARRCSWRRLRLGGGRQPGDGLAAARHARRLARRRRSASSARRGTRVARRARGGLAQRRAPPACCAATRRAPARASCPRALPAPGERVTVSARAASGAGTHARGEEHASRSPARRRRPRSSSRSTPATQARSSTTLGARAHALARSRITTPARPGASPGDLFLAPYQGLGTPGPMIADQGGSLVWFHPLPAGPGGDELRRAELRRRARADLVAGADPRTRLRAGRRRHLRLRLPPVGRGPRGQRLPGRPALDPPHPPGNRVDRRLRPGPDEPVLGRAGSPNGVLSDSVVQEIDIKTGLVMWEWHALGHIPFGRLQKPGSRVELPVGLRAHQLGRPGPPRRRADVLSQHLVAGRRGHPQRRLSLAPRRRAAAPSSSAAAPPSTGSTTPPSSRAA